jgi:hypothetical protein
MFDALAEFAVARGQFVGALLQFAQKPRIFQRDHRLIRECADKLYLPVGKRLDRWRARRMEPIALPSRIRGTPSEVRTFPSLMASSE